MSAAHLAGEAEAALDLALQAQDIALVVSLALSTDGGHVTVASQEAICTVARMGVDKAREVRNAIDLLVGNLRRPA